MRKAPFAARRGPSTAEAFKRVGYEVNGLFSFTSFAGESSASLVSLERSSTRSSTGSSRTGPLGAGLDALGGRRRLHARAARAGPRAVSPPTLELTALVVAYASLGVPCRVRDLCLTSPGQIT